MVTNIIAIIAVLVTVSGAAWYKTLREVRQEAGNFPQASFRFVTPPIEISNTLASEPNAIYASDQKPGNTVSVSVLAAESAGFIAIHESKDEKPGKIIGTSHLLQKGKSPNVVIILLREAKEGERLFAIFHLDDGDDKFDVKNDKPAADKDGNFIMMAFKILRGAEEESSIDAKTSQGLSL